MNSTGPSHDTRSKFRPTWSVTISDPPAFAKMFPIEFGYMVSENGLVADNIDAFPAGTPLTIGFWIRNTGTFEQGIGEKAVPVHLSPYLLSIEILHMPSGEPVWKAVVGNGPTDLPPNSHAGATITWDQLGSNGMQVPAGKYLLRFADDCTYSGEVEGKTFTAHCGAAYPPSVSFATK